MAGNRSKGVPSISTVKVSIVLVACMLGAVQFYFSFFENGNQRSVVIQYFKRPIDARQLYQPDIVAGKNG